jgi:hypothetical protein
VVLLCWAFGSTRNGHLRSQATVAGIWLEIEIGQFVAAPNSRSGLMNVCSPDYIDRPRLYG